jgi:nucleotide-binding universal stress UspA family protein
MNALLEALKLNIGAELFEYLSPQTQLVQGTPSHQLPKLAEEINADLVIMGTVARSGIAGILIGNTAENVLSQLQCSVLAIKPRDFVSPVS